MAESERNLGKEINAWVQTMGIILAAAWGVYTFFYKEIWVPKSAPINVTVDLSLKKIGEGTQKVQSSPRRLIPVEMKISARNPSSREIYILPSVWMASGVKVRSADVPLTSAPTISAANENVFVERHAPTSDFTVVAFGGLLEDTSLKPNEVSGRTFIFFVPANEYDYLDVVAVMPTIEKAHVLDMEWKLNNDTGQMDPTYYRLDGNGLRQGVLKPEEAADYAKARNLELQRSITRTELYLSP